LQRVFGRFRDQICPTPLSKAQEPGDRGRQ
jgi:hypothetical protein